MLNMNNIISEVNPAKIVLYIYINMHETVTIDTDIYYLY